MTILALDFDGVIFDSSREVFVVGLRAWDGLMPGSTVADGHPLTDHHGRPPEHGFDDDPLFHAFAQLTPLGNRAEDFGVALKILEAGVPVISSMGARRISGTATWRSAAASNSISRSVE